MGIKSHSIISDRTTKPVMFFSCTDPDILCRCVLDGIVQRFLNDAIERRLDRSCQAPGKDRVYSNWDLSPLRNSVRQKLDRRDPAKIIENRWSKFVRIPSQVLINFIQ